MAVSSAREALISWMSRFLVTDLMMPEIDGFALINKALEINPKLKTLVISAALEFKERLRAVTSSVPRRKVEPGYCHQPNQ